MSLFSQLLEQVDNVLGDAKTPAAEGTAGESLLDGLLNMVGSTGLTDLVKNFQEKGLGEIVNSWVRIGDNLPISTEQLMQGLGVERLQKLAEQAGVSIQSVLPTLSQLLPNVIDKLTPQGSVPTGGLLD